MVSKNQSIGHTAITWKRDSHKRCVMLRSERELPSQNTDVLLSTTGVVLVMLPKYNMQQ